MGLEPAPPEPKKTFKDYEPGFVHVDIKYLPQMPDESSRRYLFVAIDRATRWVYFRIYRDQSDASSTDFLRRLQRTAPMKIFKRLVKRSVNWLPLSVNSLTIFMGAVRCKRLRKSVLLASD